MEARLAAILFAAGLGGLAPAGTSFGQASAGGQWDRIPSEQEVAAAYPPAAKAAGVGGMAWVQCRLAKTGVVERCKPASEYPHDRGFLDAAMKLATIYHAPPQAKTSDVFLPFHFSPLATPPAAREARFKPATGEFRPLAPIGPYWPTIALNAKIGGYAAIDCRVGADGRLDPCWAADGDAPWFELATLFMARDAWMTAGPAPAGAPEPADGVWRFTVEFKIPR